MKKIAFSFLIALSIHAHAEQSRLTTVAKVILHSGQTVCGAVTAISGINAFNHYKNTPAQPIAELTQYGIVSTAGATCLCDGLKGLYKELGFQALVKKWKNRNQR